MSATDPAYVIAIPLALFNGWFAFSLAALLIHGRPRKGQR